MRNENDDDLTPDEMELLAALPGEATPPPELEERVVAGLRNQGDIRPRPAWKGKAAVAAMLLVSVSLGYIAGLRSSLSPPPATDTGPVFALLIYDPVLAAPEAQGQAAVAEASAWAGELAEVGVFRGAEKLRDDGLRLGMLDGAVELSGEFPPPGDELVLGGFFMIRADNYDDAQRIASSCPLLRYGSIIEIRAVEDI